MTDPLGLISSATTGAMPSAAPARPVATNGPAFRELLEKQIQQVNDLQADANQAMEDLTLGRRSDIETVINAAAKADIAFRMLLQVRNKMMDAYEEVKQIRV